MINQRALEVTKIKKCLKCGVIEPAISFEDKCVVQRCPKCGRELGRTGVFFMQQPVPGATVRVQMVEL